MVKLKLVKTFKPVSPPESGIGTMTLSDERYELFEDLKNRRVIVVCRKEPAPGMPAWPVKAIYFDNVECAEYFNAWDAGVPGAVNPDGESEEQVKRGPGRPPKQHVLA